MFLWSRFRKLLFTMRIKRAVAIFGSFITLFACFILYFTMDMTAFPSRKSAEPFEYQEHMWVGFEDRLKQLEHDLNKHKNTVDEIKQVIKQMPAHGPGNSGKKVILPLPFETPTEMIYDKSCSLQLDTLPSTNIQMLDVYKQLNFDNPDGGVWKQGWKIEVDERSWNKHHKLKVFVIPHSHNDPGWVKTLEEYYLSQTKHILNNMIVKLQEDPRRKFIWAEISFFSMWWDDLDQKDRDIVRRLVKNNQLEIVTGGWVMNDEACSHWISVMLQLTEGHQWLQKHLNYTPESHWSIDPFGTSSTQPKLLHEMGLKNMLIQRVHYSIKKYFARNQNLEFRWKQLWDGKGSSEILTHMMPFYSYDIPHTCGPDPKICCQFDFKRLPGHGLHCPWKVPPQAITDSNVAQKAELLLDQYRKKSSLYRTNVLLIPLGDDFRYDHSTEWDVQYNNYQALFDFMNSNLKMHVQIQFGTLSDYFKAVRAEKSMNEFPTLSGDFFTYADRDDHYFSGYYTSRPFYKRMDRILLSYIRAAEIILTLAHLSGKPGSKWIADVDVGLDKTIAEARRALALFQHHDGVTGTAKDHVVIDYGKKMLEAIKGTQNIIQQCTNLLLMGPLAETPGTDILHYNVDDIRHSHDAVSEQYTITIGPELSTKKVVIFNSLPSTRHEVVTFVVSTPFVEVLNWKGDRIKCQLSPVFEYGSTMSNSKYHLSFTVNVPALGLVSFVINAVLENDVPSETVYSSIKILNHHVDIQAPLGFPNIEVSSSSSPFTIHNSRVTAAFSNLGLLKAIKVGAHTIPVHLDFARYGARHTAERSGAYLFLPDGDAVALQIENTIVKVVEGPIFSRVIVQLPYVHHTVTLYNTPGADGLGLEIENLVEIEKTSNFELVMRLSTNINNTDNYFTDVNGYQVIRRKRFTKLPLQANYYPMPTSMYIEDKMIRLTVLTGSPLGCASLREGHLEVMLDRRLNQDDNLGVGQGVMDNHPTRHIFRVLLERKTHVCQGTVDDHPAGFPSLSAHVALQSLLNPMIRLLRTDDDDLTPETSYSPAPLDFGADFTLPTLRTGVMVQGRDYVGVVLQRQYVDLCFADKVLLQQFPLSHGTVNLFSSLPVTEDYKLRRTSLSFLHVQESLNIIKDIPLCPMEMQSLIISR